MFFGMDPVYIVIRLLALLPALVLHEFAHGYSAWKLGDPTPKMQNRLTLNPLNHLDPVGTLMIIFAPIGWAKPVQVNPYNFKNPERDFMISTICGPLSNIVQGIFWGLMIRLFYGLATSGTWPGVLDSAFFDFLILAALINFVLAIFNLIPLGPLDGHRVLAYFLPYEQKRAYEQFNKQYGMAVLIGLIALSFMTRLNILGTIILTPALYAVWLLSGIPAQWLGLG